MFPVTSGLNGGVQSLLISYISALSDRSDLTVRLYDYSNGLIYSRISDEVLNKIDFVSLDNSDWVIPNQGNETFVLTDFLWQKYPFFFRCVENVKILMLDVFYPTWDSFYKAKFIDIPLLKGKTINLLSEKRGVAFIEETGLNKFLNLGGNGVNVGNIVPIPISIGYNKKNERRIANRELTIGYIGRAVKWKIMPVVKIIDDIAKNRLNVKLRVYTQNVNEFDRIVKKYTSDSVVEIEYIEDLHGEELVENIIDNVDIGYAMGTSGLLLSSLGVPTILSDFSNRRFPDSYRYRWIYEAEYGNVGKDIKDIESFNLRNSLPVMINKDLFDEALRCKKYVESIHELNKVCDVLVDCCKKTSLTVSDVRNVVFRQQYFLYLIKRVIRKNKLFYGWGIK